MPSDQITADGGTSRNAYRLAAEHIAVDALDFVGRQDIHGQPVDGNILKGGSQAHGKGKGGDHANLCTPGFANAIATSAPTRPSSCIR